MTAPCAAERALQTIRMLLDQPEGCQDWPALVDAIERQVVAGLREVRVSSGSIVEGLRDLAPLVAPHWEGVEDVVVEVERMRGAVVGPSLRRALEFVAEEFAARRRPRFPNVIAGRLRELAVEIEVETGRMLLSADASDDDISGEVRTLALAAGQAALLIAMCVPRQTGEVS